MPSAKEMRCWILLGLILVWGVFLGALWDEISWARGGSPEATLHLLQRATALHG
jgi:hypothetical protein